MALGESGEVTGLGEVVAAALILAALLAPWVSALPEERPFLEIGLQGVESVLVGLFILVPS